MTIKPEEIKEKLSGHDDRIKELEIHAARTNEILSNLKTG
jgi:hypothetical protein